MRRVLIALLAPLLLGAASPPRLAPLRAATLDGAQLDLAVSRHRVVVVHFGATTLRYRFHAGGTMLDEATLGKIIPPLLEER